jgi:hypothetical protein
MILLASISVCLGRRSPIIPTDMQLGHSQILAGVSVRYFCLILGPVSVELEAPTLKAAKKTGPAMQGQGGTQYRNGINLRPASRQIRGRESPGRLPKATGGLLLY